MVPEGVVFTLTVPTKGTRPDEAIQAFFTRYRPLAVTSQLQLLSAMLEGKVKV